MRKIKLTPFARVLIGAIAIIAIVFGLWKAGIFTKARGQVQAVFNKNDSADDMYAKAGEIVKEDGTINISLDEWIGYKSIIDANGGLRTAKGSIYDQLGLKVNISVINDATQSSNALIKGDLDGAGYTVNRFAFLYNKFNSNNVPVKMGFITNQSTGGDGIIAKDGINSIEDLKGKVIGVPRYSESQVFTEWLLSKSNLSDADIKDIRSKMVLFDTPDDCAKAFFAGELDAAATWQPYLSQATETAGAHLLFSTKDAPNMILSGVVFRDDFINNNRETISKLMEGALKARDLYAKDGKAMQESFPMFATMSEKEITDQTADASLVSCKDNSSFLSKGGAAYTLFEEMSNMWKQLGEDADKSNVSDAFDATITKDLTSKFEEDVETKNSISADDKKKAENNKALLSQNLSINFEVGGAGINPDSFVSLNEFANTAKLLNNTIIQIEGNTDSTGDYNQNKQLSEDRARSIAKYLQAQGIDSSRFVIIGNGSDKPVGDNNTAEGQAANRRTDVYFKTVE